MLFIIDTTMDLEPMRVGLVAKGRNVVAIMPKRALKDIAPETDAKDIVVSVYYFLARRIEDADDVPVWLVEIEEAAPDRVYYHSVVLGIVGGPPTDQELLRLVESEVLEHRRVGVTAQQVFETWQCIRSRRGSGQNSYML
jgi:hypothetical protein